MNRIRRKGRNSSIENKKGPDPPTCEHAACCLTSIDACCEAILSRSSTLYRCRRSASAENISSISSAAIASIRNQILTMRFKYC